MLALLIMYIIGLSLRLSAFVLVCGVEGGGDTLAQNLEDALN
jgi:hypothetical protein